jgi:hypothetical protein
VATVLPKMPHLRSLTVIDYPLSFTDLLAIVSTPSLTDTHLDTELEAACLMDELTETEDAFDVIDDTTVRFDFTGQWHETRRTSRVALLLLACATTCFNRWGRTENSACCVLRPSGRQTTQMTVRRRRRGGEERTSGKLMDKMNPFVHKDCVDLCTVHATCGT